MSFPWCLGAGLRLRLLFKVEPARIVWRRWRGRARRRGKPPLLVGWPMAGTPPAACRTPRVRVCRGDPELSDGDHASAAGLLTLGRSAVKEGQLARGAPGVQRIAWALPPAGRRAEGIAARITGCMARLVIGTPSQILASARRSRRAGSSWRRCPRNSSRRCDCGLRLAAFLCPLDATRTGSCLFRYRRSG